MGSSIETLQPQLLAMNFAFPAVATIAVLLRIYIRVWTRTFAVDDWLICLAGTLYWAETATAYKVIKYNWMGYHVKNIPYPNPQATLAWKYSYATEILYNPILAVVKFSILFFLLRLTGQKLGVKRAIWIIMALNTIVMITTLFLTVFRCVPIASHWAPTDYPDAKCLNFANFVTGTACASIFTDALVLILPTWIVYNLRMAQKQKLILIAILSLGLVGIIAGVVRIVLLDIYDRKLAAGKLADYNYNVYFSLSTIEISLVIIAACGPSFKPLVSKILPKFFSSRDRNGPQYSYNRGTSGRMYDLDNLSRGRRTQNEGNHILVETRNDERDSTGTVDPKAGIMLTTETEVKWQEDDVQQPSNRGSSTDSLVRPRK
ncbi:hypothetical protein BJY01DRAFT_264447 [Aspergillus pseudoustus]|uniref:Rhodopsin domain-containing protein n=1 Tax=Aspergillus pseudoustus TaxID=1810923 RepID=A0ABR4JRQ1_9EURO